MRVLYDNAIDRAVLTASGTASGFALANLQASRKSDLWRVNSLTARLGATWTTPEQIQLGGLAFCDLSPTATMRVRVTNEAQVANYALWSEDFTNAAWNARWGGAATITANDATYLAPSGAQTVDKVVATSGGSGVGQSFALNAGQTYTFSCWVASPSAACVLGFGTSASAAPALATTTVPGGAGLVRYSKSFTPGTSGTYYVGVADTSSLQTFYIWGAQLEIGSAATSYYPATSAAAARPLGYIDAWQSYTYDSGNVLCCPAPAVKLRFFTAAQAARAYAFGGGAHAAVYLPTSIAAYGLALDIADANNLPGFIEASFMFAGAYWEAATNVDYGASASWDEKTKTSDADSGDQISDIGPKNKKLKLPMSKLNRTDRATLWDILRGNGLAYPVFVDLDPAGSDLAYTRDHQVYGKLVAQPDMTLPYFNIAAATLEIKSV